jgi:TatD DNase family protein
MRLIDLHTHNSNSDADIYILNSNGDITTHAENISVGLHPWNIDDMWEQRMQEIATIATDKRVRAIGECGIDLVKSSSTVSLQTEILQRHIELSKSLHKPLILHVVKGQEIILNLRRTMHPEQAWIIHGFRGKPQQAAQYMAAGLYLSFGERCNSDALAATPLDRLFIESDESTLPIAELYKKAADTLGVPLEKLAASVEENCKRCGIVEQHT